MPKGRDATLDADMARLGLVPATHAAKDVGVTVLALYRARDARKLAMVRSGHYWFVRLDDVRHLWATNPRRRTWSTIGKQRRGESPPKATP